jgi:effector-binding domain-containing protein
MNDMKIQVVEKIPYLYVEGRGAKETMGDAMGSALGEVWSFMEHHGVAPAGGALSAYYDYSEGDMNFRAGFIVTDEDLAAAQGNVKSDLTPGGRVIRMIHRGPYSGLEAAYGQMMQFLQENELAFSPPTIEIYLNDPSQVPEDQLLTEIYQSLG